MNADLARRAAERGVLTEYEDWAGHSKAVPEETVEAVLAAMEPYDDSPSPLTVVRVGDPAAEGRPVGEYDLPGDRTLLVAPRACPLPPRTWGWMAQLYGVRSQESWGIGDFGDLARLAEWSAREAGAGFVLVNPLHAAAPRLPQEPSPYFPVSRRFLNPLYLDVEELPELGRVPADDRESILALAREARALNAGDRIDRDAVFRLKWAALTKLFPYCSWWPEVEDFRTREGRPLDDFATWCALAEVHDGPFQRWPAELRDPRSSAVEEFVEAESFRPNRHVWLQYHCARQLGEAQRRARDAGMPVGLVLDLAVGVDPSGADAWAQQDVFARGMTVGAPPDSFNQKGQDWRLPPWRPDRLRATGYAPFREMVRATLAHAGGIRIDHAMGLFRLFWVPAGMSAAEGTYVRYPADDLLGILVYECHQAGAVAVAEDLGTVEPGVPETLRANGILGSAVLWFEEGGAASYPEKAFTSVTTHDLPTARGFWTDEALKVQAELGLLGRPAEDQAADNAAQRAHVTSLLEGEGLTGPDATVDELVVAMHEFVGRTPSLMVAVALGDAVGDPRQPNMPGTKDEYPNWRLPLPVALEDLAVGDVVEAVRTARSRGPAAR